MDAIKGALSGSTVAKAQAGNNRLSPDNAAVLLVDHQTGLLQLVKDYGVAEFRNNVLALAKTAKVLGLPVILTTSREDGPNGPLMPELKAMFPDAPYIARPGEINAWDNPDFLKAVKDTGRNKLIIAGVVTDVCVAFPTISALAEGYDVYVVTDASGTFNTAVRETTMARMVAAGAVPMNWFATACELQRDWRLHGGLTFDGLAGLLNDHLPEYSYLISSHVAATAATAAGAGGGKAALAAPPAGDAVAPATQQLQGLKAT